MDNKGSVDNSALCESRKDFLEAMLDSMNDGVLACDQDGNILLYNQAMRHFFNLPDQLTVLDEWFSHAIIRHADNKTTVSLGSKLVDQILAGNQSTIDRIENAFTMDKEKFGSSFERIEETPVQPAPQGGVSTFVFNPQTGQLEQR